MKPLAAWQVSWFGCGGVSGQRRLHQRSAVSIMPTMDQALPSLPPGWVEAIERGEADLAAGRVVEIDTEALCREIESDADELEQQIKAGRVSPA